MEWRGGQNQVRLGHTGVLKLFRGMRVEPNFHNGIQVKDSSVCAGANSQVSPQGALLRLRYRLMG